MLVLSRKQGETICIGGNIEVTVLATTGNRVRLGIAAPRDVNIVRKELLEKTARLFASSDSKTGPDEVYEVELSAHSV